MELTLSLLFIAAVGAGAGLGLRALLKKFSFSDRWAGWFFLCLAGGGVNSLAAVAGTGARSILSTTSGLLAGDFLDALINCILLVCFALPAALFCGIMQRRCPAPGQPVKPWMGLVFGLAVSQSLLAPAVLLWESWFPGLWDPASLLSYCFLMPALTFALAMVFGRKWGGSARAAVGFTAVLVFADLAGILFMFLQNTGPIWGLALAQTAASAFFTRWNLAAAMLLSTSQTVVPVTPSLLVGASLLTRLAFLGGWYCGGRRKEPEPPNI